MRLSFCLVNKYHFEQKEVQDLYPDLTDLTLSQILREIKSTSQAENWGVQRAARKTYYTKKPHILKPTLSNLSIFQYHCQVTMTQSKERYS